ncbi:MAG: hypothetical protein LC109_08555 [Bacteroidia bacterium]|nr:hypothetical protein [Bacteroidia bacterium]
MTTEKEQRTANSTFAIGGVSFSADSFVVIESSVLRINICAEKPAHRKSANRQHFQHITKTSADKYYLIFQFLWKTLVSQSGNLYF